MADKNSRNMHVKVDFVGGVFMFGVFVLIVLFWGTPDLHDAIVHRLMTP